MSNLHNLPPDDRPRERLLKYGVETLSLQELLAVILGRGVRGISVMEISKSLVLKFGSILSLTETSIEDLVTIKGLGLVKACQIRACFELSRRLNYHTFNKKTKNKTNLSPEDVFSAVRLKIINFHKEHLLVVSLDNSNKIINIDTVSIGTLNNSLVHPRETFEVAIKHHAAQIILCHNHPSGELIPSEEDLNITRNLIQAGNILGIPVIDHLIIDEGGFFSFKKRKIIF